MMMHGQCWCCDLAAQECAGEIPRGGEEEEEALLSYKLHLSLEGLGTEFDLYHTMYVLLLC